MRESRPRRRGRLCAAKHFRRRHRRGPPRSGRLPEGHSRYHTDVEESTHRAGTVYGRKTIQQLARSLDVHVRDVSKAARRVLGLDAGSARDHQFTLSSTQCRRVADALGKKPQPPLLGLAEVDDASPPEPRGRARLRFRSDPPADPADLKLRDLHHGLWVHPEVSDRLRGWTHLYKRLGIVLQHLAAHGRSTVVKGCMDANRGWRRSPLGGNNGMQYYLWWTPCGSAAARTLDLPERAILVRDVRHHDNHAPLAAGGLGDYLPLTTPEHLNGDIAGSPWTDEQIDFVEDDSPVRLILGRPGSGKTTVLWKAVEARSGQRVLYLTWSSALTRHAEERFASFAPADVQVIARDFTTFLGEVCGADVERQPLSASRARFDQVLTRLGRDMAGPWARRQHALHAELRAVYFGRAIPGDHGCVTDHGIACLRDGTYTALRGGDDGITAGVGAKAAKALLKVGPRLARVRDRVGSVFPELVAATRAIERLRGDELPEGFEAFDRIVVDEVQDLTLLETAVVVELCGAIARARGRAPWLLMAGDAGQTVRPTGFEWAPLNDLLALRLRRPEKFQLNEHLRCPSRIAEVVERASRRYADIEKEVRPTSQHRQRGGEHVDAHLVHVHVSERAEAVRLLERLDETDDVVVVSPRNDRPDWVPAELRGVVLTPEETKGLEYQSVCVLDPGRLLSRLRPENLSYGTDAELDRPARRTAIDHLRVTLSRATETLVFVDVEAADDDLHQSLELLGDAAPYSAEDLLDHLANSDASAEERVSARTNDARALIDSAPRRAWQRACQAVRLLGEPGLPNGVSDLVLRGDARSTLLATAARLLVEGVPAGVERREVVSTAMAVTGTEKTPDEFGAVRPDEDAGGGRDAVGGSGREQAPPVVLAAYENMAFRELDFWSRDRRAPPFDLLEAARQLGNASAGGGDWLRAALLSAAQALRDGLNASAVNPASAAAFAGADVEAWLRLTGYAGDAAARAHALRGKAFDALLKGGGADEPRSDRRARLTRAELVLETIAPDPVRLGRLREAQERPEDAVGAYETAGRQKDALRVLRNFGRWERAVELADGETQGDLDWLLELKALVERRPPQQNRRLRNGERDRLEKLLDEIQKRPPRKSVSGSG